MSILCRMHLLLVNENVVCCAPTALLCTDDAWVPWVPWSNTIRSCYGVLHHTCTCLCHVVIIQECNMSPPCYLRHAMMIHECLEPPLHEAVRECRIACNLFVLCGDYPSIAEFSALRVHGCVTQWLFGSRGDHLGMRQRVKLPLCLWMIEINIIKYIFGNSRSQAQSERLVLRKLSFYMF